MSSGEEHRLISRTAAKNWPIHSGFVAISSRKEGVYVHSQFAQCRALNESPMLNTSVEANYFEFGHECGWADK